VDGVDGEEQRRNEGGLASSVAGASKDCSEHGQGEDGGDSVQGYIGRVKLEFVEALWRKAGSPSMANKRW
jgi:hypothetical protein